MFAALFDDTTSSTYGSTGDRPINSIVQAPDQTLIDLNTGTTEDNVEITIPSGDFDPTYYKIHWTGSAWQMVARSALSTVASWNKTSITANGTDSCTLSGLPNPTTVVIELPLSTKLAANTTLSYTITDGSFTFKTNDPGTYTIRALNRFPYAPYSQQITAT
jgi:hypothetical protein